MVGSVLLLLFALFSSHLTSTQHITPHRTTPRHTTSFPISSHLTSTYPISSHLTTPTAHHTTPHHTTTYLTTSHHIPSHHTTPQLNIDLASVFDITFATQGPCEHCGVLGQRCGAVATGTRCTDEDIALTSGGASALVNTFANDNAAFLRAFAVAYARIAAVGYALPSEDPRSDGATAFGKLGTLTSLDLSTCG
jgi:hypothetical protein